MKLISRLVTHISEHPALFLFFRGLLENDFVSIRELIRNEMLAGEHLRTLDLGCGPGAFARHFPADSYVGVDINARYIGYARRRFHGDFRVGDARRLEFPDGFFNQVLIFGLLHHVDDAIVHAMLGECRRVLTAGGSILVIEDIPAVSRLNVIGHLIHLAENGRHIRPPEAYRRLYSEIFTIEKERIIASGICDYHAAVLRR
ncbi:MAG: class I SAM-dependent methyltransferase [Vicinamibacteria bacterium]|nr:class I SAM-dependent methyltransferase [Vicinamibacteria bacterium]